MHGCRLIPTLDHFMIGTGMTGWEGDGRRSIRGCLIPLRCHTRIEGAPFGQHIHGSGENTHWGSDRLHALAVVVVALLICPPSLNPWLGRTACEEKNRGEEQGQRSTLPCSHGPLRSVVACPVAAEITIGIMPAARASLVVMRRPPWRTRFFRPSRRRACRRRESFVNQPPDNPAHGESFQQANGELHGFHLTA